MPPDSLRVASYMGELERCAEIRLSGAACKQCVFGGGWGSSSGYDGHPCPEPPA